MTKGANAEEHIMEIMGDLLLSEARAYIRVYGRVQGVGYRFFTERHARRLGLKGYVRNLSDGSVEVVVEGDRVRIEELIERLRKGPLLAKVERIDVRWEKPKGEFFTFTILF